jgi:hypothetical protein
VQDGAAPQRLLWQNAVEIRGFFAVCVTSPVVENNRLLRAGEKTFVQLVYCVFTRSDV